MQTSIQWAAKDSSRRTLCLTNDSVKRDCEQGRRPTFHPNKKALHWIA
jgi:hypothetical protein